MIKFAIIDSDRPPPETKSGIVYTGKLELVSKNNNCGSEIRNTDNKTIVMKVALNEEQLSEIITEQGVEPHNLHLILYESVNAFPLNNEKGEMNNLTKGESLAKKYKLTKSEIGILESLALGLKYKDIAEKHFIALNTVKCHVSNIFRKFDVHNRTSAVSKYMAEILD